MMDMYASKIFYTISQLLSLNMNYIDALYYSVFSGQDVEKEEAG